MVALRSRKPRTPPEELAPHFVWALAAHPGHLPMMTAAGTVAAPLLAGFSLTLLVLILPSLEERPTSASAQTVADAPLSRFPEQAAILLLLAGLLLIACLQATVTMTRFRRTPAEMREWFPELITTAKPPAIEEGNDAAGLQDMLVDGTWYTGEVRLIQRNDLEKALRWADWARGTYHAGIACLLLGLALLAVPPSGDADEWRWVLTGVAALGVLGELVWIRDASKKE